MNTNLTTTVALGAAQMRLLKQIYANTIDTPAAAPIKLKKGDMEPLQRLIDLGFVTPDQRMTDAGRAAAEAGREHFLVGLYSDVTPMAKCYALYDVQHKAVLSVGPTVRLAVRTYLSQVSPDRKAVVEKELLRRDGNIRVTTMTSFTGDFMGADLEYLL